MPEKAVAAHTGFPPQIKYIVGNEACERFSYYGMRSILVVFMIQYLKMEESSAKGAFHFFLSAAYFTPLIGGYLADRYLGKYRTILWLSLFYCLGHATLAFFDSKWGLFAGLTLIAFGAGGVKPCVSAFVGDQFTSSNAHLIDKVFQIFYWMINWGAFTSIALIPKILPSMGPSWAFGIPGILMGIATLIFVLGRKHYIIVPPSGVENSSRFFSVVFYALMHQKERQPGQSFLDVAKPSFGEEKVEGAKSAFAVCKVLVLVSAFWSLYDQQAGAWVLQAAKMNLQVGPWKLEASQINGAGVLMILVFIPIFGWIIYPAIERLGARVTPLRKMGTGMLLTGFSFVAVAIIEALINQGHFLSVAWQLIPLLILTIAEILVSIPGLEFAYTQAPRSMKSTMMSFWLLTISAGNLFTSLISFINPFKERVSEYGFYATLMFVVALLFVFLASRYKMRHYINQ